MFSAGLPTELFSCERSTEVPCERTGATVRDTSIGACSADTCTAGLCGETTIGDAGEIDPRLLCCDDAPGVFRAEDAKEDTLDICGGLFCVEVSTGVLIGDISTLAGDLLTGLLIGVV